MDDANRGLIWVAEHPGARYTSAEAAAFQEGTIVSRSSLATRELEVPALRFDNPNPRDQSFVRFDGIEGENLLIDAKWSLTSKSKQVNDLHRMAEALRQNPMYKGILELPTQSKASNALRFLEREGLDGILKVRVRPLQ